MSIPLIVLIILFFLSFFAGSYQTHKIKFSREWFWGIYAPILIMFIVSWITHIPWFWIIANFLSVMTGKEFGQFFEERKLSSKEIEQMERIADLQLPKDLPEGIKDEEIAIVLMNMGGPCCIEAVEPFLRKLFNDSMIIRFPFAQSFFADMLIRSRLKEVQGRYKLIGGGSPILPSSFAQVKALTNELKKRGRSFDVFLSFNYSYPLPHDTIAQIKSMNKKYILTLSLYPHYSLSTTASNIFYLKQEAFKNYHQVDFLESYSYHLYEGYIKAFVDRIHEVLLANEKLDDFYLLFSAHGTPVYFVQEGDPYAFLISQSISRILTYLNREHNWSICYQSAVGPLVWLKPSTDAALKALGQRGIKKIIVVPISFVTDHIETLCEIDIEYRHLAKEHGIVDFRMSKAIECHPDFISALANCVENSVSKQVKN